MKTTYFRPSIHGWPFGNSWKYKFPFGGATPEMGYCGGMCWTALQRFYAGIPIDRGTPAPPQGDPLYDEIFMVQQGSLLEAKVGYIWEWQKSPDLGKDGLGDRTQKEWQTVKGYLDASKPVTLTVIVHANDPWPWDLSDNHRVVAYAYDVRPVDPAEGAPSGAGSQVTIYIYDPNYENDDEVCLTFFTGAKRSKIRLRHNKPDEEVHGFFLDDVPRDYASPDSTTVRIDKCEQTAISSTTRANYDLQFSWRCSFVPYFCIQVDGVDWQYNSALQSSYEPITKPNGDPFANKQCPARTGSITANLELPRARSKVAVRLLDTPDYYQSVEVDAEPAINCYPYVRTRASGDGPQVCDPDISDADLFIKDPKPTQAAVQQLDTSPFRWVISENLLGGIIGPPRDATSEFFHDVSVVSFDLHCLGNIVVPILANFVERNLATPTRTSGVVTIRDGRTGRTVQRKNLTTLTSQAQKIFDGFKNNPADYDNNTTVEFVYKSIDNFNVAAQGKAFFYGRSIIHRTISMAFSYFDPDRIGWLDAARGKVEQLLIEIAKGLPHGPRPRPSDPVVLLERLRSHRQLQGLIDQTLKPLWSNSDISKEIWKMQSEILKQVDQDKTILIDKPAKVGDVLKAANELREAEQRKCDSVIINTFAQKAIEQLRRNPTVIAKLKSL